MEGYLENFVNAYEQREQQRTPGDMRADTGAEGVKNMLAQLTANQRAVFFAKQNAMPNPKLTLKKPSVQGGDPSSID